MRASSASLELLAPRADVWGFLAEPYHLSDWWPGITGVEPDRRGFAPGARWKVHSTKRNVFTGSRVVETMLLLAPDLADLWQEAGVLHARLGNMRAALDALGRFVAQAPETPARHQAAALIQQLKTKLN